jgi:CRISPR/Cas system-associated exonuclease Cas4 (RecB family)
LWCGEEFPLDKVDDGRDNEHHEVVCENFWTLQILMINRVTRIVRPLTGRYYAKNESSAFTDLSFSRIDTYQQCPYRFKLNYIDKKPAIPNTHMVYGSALHIGVSQFAEMVIENPRMLNEDFATLRKKAVEAFQLDFDAQIKILERELSGDQIQEKRKEGSLLMWRYANREKASLFTTYMHDKPVETVNDEEYSDGYDSDVIHVVSLRHPFLVEKKFTVPTEVVVDGKEISFTGIFDRIDDEFSTVEDTGVYRVIIEYKTNLKKYAMKKHLMQVKMYAWAYYKLYAEDIPLKHCYVTSISTGENQVVTFDKQAVEADVKKLLYETATAISEKKFDPKPAYSNCMFCSFRKSCPF